MCDVNNTKTSLGLIKVFLDLYTFFVIDLKVFTFLLSPFFSKKMCDRANKIFRKCLEAYPCVRLNRMTITF